MRNDTPMWTSCRAIGYWRLIFADTVSILQVTELSAADSAVSRTATDGRSVAEIAHDVVVRAGRLDTRDTTESLQQHARGATPRRYEWLSLRPPLA